MDKLFSYPKNNKVPSVFGVVCREVIDVEYQGFLMGR